jgi:hypothetical protein
MKGKTEGGRVRSAVCVARFAAISVGFLVCTFGLPAPGESADPSSMITLRVANYARVPDGVLAAAERKAGGVLHEAGIDAKWLECPLAGAQVDPEPHPGPADFFLTVIRKVMRERRSEQEALGFALGFALPCSQGKTGCMAYIFYWRIETLAANGDAGLSDILGHAMVHEIGHLLLGPGHSRVGIMRAEWTREDLASAARNQLSFTSQQMDLLRASVYSANRKPN